MPVLLRWVEVNGGPTARAGPTLCSACGAILAKAVDDRGVVTMADFRVPFRRHTDHVVCPQCLLSYRVTDLLAGPVTSRWRLPPAPR